MYTSLPLIMASLATMASAEFDCHGPYFSFYNRPGSALSYQRLDPALFPGTQSPHLHSFDGGDTLSASMAPGDAQKSTCTTARIKLDKSLYWRPTLYWNGNNTGFYRVLDRHVKLYYKFMDGLERANVTEFPEGFAMMAGNPFKRSDDGKNPGGVKWTCLGEAYARVDSPGFPKGITSCKQGLFSELSFPVCWNGKDLDPKNPDAHMAYPTAGGKGIEACPVTHRAARFPTIFAEFWYDTSAFDGHYTANDNPWVLSNGDPTGFGFHADFRNGWDKGVLAKAMAPEGYCNCGCGCAQEDIEACFGPANVNKNEDAQFKACSAQLSANGAESVSPVERLPGCNPIQPGPAPATVVSGAGCIAGPTAAPVPTNDAVRKHRRHLRQHLRS